MNSIEKLPKSVDLTDNRYLPKSVDLTDNRYFEIQIYVTAWGKLCLSYVNPFRKGDSFNERILSVVVEGENKIEKKMTNDYTEIFDATDIDDAVEITLQRLEGLKSLNKNVKFNY